MKTKYISYILFLVMAFFLLYEGRIKFLENDFFSMVVFFMPFIPTSLISFFKFFIPSVEILLAVLLIIPTIRKNVNYGIYFFTLVTMLYGILTVTVFRNYSYLCTPEGGCTLQYSYYAKHLPAYAVCCGLSLLNVFVMKKSSQSNVDKG